VCPPPPLYNINSNYIIIIDVDGLGDGVDVVVVVVVFVVVVDVLVVVVVVLLFLSSSLLSLFLSLLFLLLFLSSPLLSLLFLSLLFCCWCCCWSVAGCYSSHSVGARCHSTFHLHYLHVCVGIATARGQFLSLNEQVNGSERICTFLFQNKATLFKRFNCRMDKCHGNKSLTWKQQFRIL